MTELRRIDLTASADLTADISNLCTLMQTGQYKLAATFVYGNELVLIFQR